MQARAHPHDPSNDRSGRSAFVAHHESAKVASGLAQKPLRMGARWLAGLMEVDAEVLARIEGHR